MGKEFFDGDAFIEIKQNFGRILILCLRPAACNECCDIAKKKGDRNMINSEKLEAILAIYKKDFLS